MSTYNDIKDLDELDVLEHPDGTDYQLVDRYSREQLPNKQDALTAGDRINITNNVISAETEIDDTQTTLSNTWSAKKLDGNYVTQEQINKLLQTQATQVQEVLNIGGGNLIPYPYSETTKTENGVTFTDNGDRSITINGLATEDTYFYLAGTAILSSTFTIPRTHHYRLDYKDGICPNVWLSYNVYEPTATRYNQMSSTTDSHNWEIFNDNIISDPVPCALYIRVLRNVEYVGVTIYPELFDLDDTSNVSIQPELTAGPGITIDSNDVISAKIDSDTIKFNSNSEIALASEIVSEISSLSLHDSEHTSQISSLSQSMSEIASTAAQISENDSLQDSQISSLSTAESELASELDGKQDSLTAGTNITIQNNVISATGGGGGSDVELIDTFEGNVVSALNEFYTYLSQMTEEQLRRCYITVTYQQFIMIFRFTERPAAGTSYIFSCYQPSASDANAVQIIKMIAAQTNSTYGIWTIKSGASSLAAAITYAAVTTATGTYKLYA